jgi:formylglycine-generating enzyme required for sulfatase activity
MVGKIFISYRRDDAAGDARGICDGLVTRFGRSNVFMDVDTLLIGQRFDVELGKALDACDVLVAVIGPRWMELLTKTASDGGRDYVREEIAAALKRGIVVVPIRVGHDSRMPPLPASGDLPPDIRDLVLHQRHDVTHEHFRRDVAELITGIQAVRGSEHSGKPWWRTVAAVGIIAAVLGGALLAYQYYQYANELARAEAKRTTDEMERQRVTKIEEDRAAAEARRSMEEAERQRLLKIEVERIAAEAQRNAEEVLKKNLAKIEEERAATEVQRRALEEDRQRLAAMKGAEDEKKHLASHSCAGVEILVGSEKRCLRPGSGKTEWFKDCPRCPEMVIAPAGSFTMGSPKDEPQRFDSEDQIQVTINKALAVGRFAVMRGEFAAFVAATGHRPDGGCHILVDEKWKLDGDRSWHSPGFARDDRHPAVCVNWNDVRAYTAWLSTITGRKYRLMSEAEREYVARAGTPTPFWWGRTITTNQANYDGNDIYSGGGLKGEWRKTTVPVTSFAPNPWGLYNVHGNVWEWTEDCLSEKNSGNPADGSPRTAQECSLRVLRGGSWYFNPRYLRAANRGRYRPDYRGNNAGFRVARTL